MKPPSLNPFTLLTKYRPRQIMPGAYLIVVPWADLGKVRLYRVRPRLMVLSRPKKRDPETGAETTNAAEWPRVRELLARWLDS